MSPIAGCDSEATRQPSQTLTVASAAAAVGQPGSSTPVKATGCDKSSTSRPRRKAGSHVRPSVRDLLVRLAPTGLLAARWSDPILDEMIESILERQPEVCRQPAEPFWRKLVSDDTVLLDTSP